MVGIPPDILVLVLALLLDLITRELPNRFHPTAWMGQTISVSEKLVPKTAKGQLIYGAAVAIVIPCLWGGAAFLLERGLNLLHPVAYILVGAILLKTTFALKMLHQSAASIRSLLLKGDLSGVRSGMSALVSRDPSELTAEQATAATVESVSENITDSLAAPLLAFALFGLPGAFAYRAINTLDSMIGYHGKYEYLGKASAKIDDLVNFIPARVTAMLLVLSGVFLPGQKASGAWRIMWRDHSRTESPNAGWTMSSMAGALGVSLEKVDHYSLGDATRPVEPEDISHAIQSLYLVTGMIMALAIGIIFLIDGIF